MQIGRGGENSKSQNHCDVTIQNVIEESLKQVNPASILYPFLFYPAYFSFTLSCLDLLCLASLGIALCLLANFHLVFAHAFSFNLACFFSWL